MLKRCHRHGGRSGNIDQEVGIGISAVELVGVAIAAIGEELVSRG